MMPVQDKTVKLTMAQALVRHLANQFIDIDGQRTRLCAGGFAIFGHGNVTCLGEALYEHRKELPLWRGQNEQSMALGAIGYTKQKLRKQFMFATASAGPGTTNMLTAAGVAHTNRLPLLLLGGDTFQSRLPDPVLQQVEHFGDPTLSVNDGFRAVSRYFDRITHPAQIIQSLPAAIQTLLDPGDCGPAFIGLPQDIQGAVYEYPQAFFEERLHRIRRLSPDNRELDDAVALLRSARRPLIIAGGGVQYSEATGQLAAFAEAFGIPVVETIAGRANLLGEHPLNCGPLGVTGSDSANHLARDADVIIAIGTRLQDFTTGSWTAFDADARFISINAARHDAAKHRSLPVVGDARQSLDLMHAAMGDYKCPGTWTERAAAGRQAWHAYVDRNIEPGNRPASYAQAIGAVNRLCDPRDRVVAAAGGLPGELAANWRTLSDSTIDIEYGFSCMGYEIAGAWGARIAQMETEPQSDTIVFVGDGSYMMMNSDIYSSVLSGKKLIILVLDNGGFAVINKLQNNTGNVSFNNLIADCNIAGAPFAVDFEAHARAMGAGAETLESMAEFDAAFARAKASETTYVIAMKVDAYDGWTTEGHTWWEVGIPGISNRSEVNAAREQALTDRQRQRKGI
jgi:3D-(3,5/4)-trihydroxycyclohexane-1,2-dione acylhydrolase (decyclizing)